MKASKLIDLTKLKFYELDQDPLINLFESNGYNVINVYKFLRLIFFDTQKTKI